MTGRLIGLIGVLALTGACNGETNLGQTPEDTDDATGSATSADSAAEGSGTSGGGDASASASSDDDSGDGTDTGEPNVEDPCLDQIAAGTWQTITTDGAPEPMERYDRLVEWAGDSMVVMRKRAPFDGALYDVCSDTWIPIAEEGKPFVGPDHGVGVHWDGSQILVWVMAEDYAQLSTFDPATNSWSARNVLGEPGLGTSEVPRVGDEFFRINLPVPPLDGSSTAGQRYDTSAELWTPIAAAGAPTPRETYSGLVGDSSVVVYGGFTSGAYGHDGGIYDIAADAWTSIPPTGWDPLRDDSEAVTVWDGENLWVWGGTEEGQPVNDGMLYRSQDDTWVPIPAAGAPMFRRSPVVARSENKIFVWGGLGVVTDPAGGVYDLDTSTWALAPEVGAPTPTAAADVFSFAPGRAFLYNLAAEEWRIFDLDANAWQSIDQTDAAAIRTDYHQVWTGGRLMFWGGSDYDDGINPGQNIYAEGAMYRPPAD